MRTILNFVPIVEGGGLQNSLSFLKTLAHDPARKLLSLALVRRGSALEGVCAEAGIENIAVPNNTLGRLGFERGCRKAFSRGQVCFTMFGPPMLSSRNYLVNAVGCAYSNLFYPEIHFWKHAPFVSRNKAELIDVYRRSLLKHADYWIFETEALRKRAVEICGFPEERVGVVRMATSALVSPDKVDRTLRDRLDKQLPSGFRILSLCGTNPNKRTHFLPWIAEQLRKKGEQGFTFILTLPPENPYTARVLNAFRGLSLEDRVCNVGPVPAEQIATLIDCCDAMCTLSVLESFSNNFVEAWAMRRPLIATDADWARDSCGKAALYVNPESPEECAVSLQRLLKDSHLRDQLTAEGQKQLASYPSASAKNECYYREIEKATALGFCAHAERNRIIWPKIRRA